VSLGFDPEVPAGFQDADLEMAAFEQEAQRRFARRVDVYVPVEGSSAARTIDRGSGIVGRVHGHHVQLDYEGNRYGAANLKTFADRVRQAWGRQSESYPTVARMTVPLLQVVKVGEFHPDTGRVALVNEHLNDRLLRWLGLEGETSLEIPMEQLLTSDGR
jgi:hypothetical protein